MSDFDPAKDYYKVLGADESTPHRELHRLYKRAAATRHPDKGGSEEEMKSVNEAYRVLSNDITRGEYDAERSRPMPAAATPVTVAPAGDVGLLGHGLSAFLCLLIGLFLLVLVRMQWFWFLWPLVMVAAFVILFGIFMARGAMHAINASLPISNPFRRHTRVQEAIFWSAVLVSGYGVYLLLTEI